MGRFPPLLWLLLLGLLLLPTAAGRVLLDLAGGLRHTACVTRCPRRFGLDWLEGVADQGKNL